jgi:outer membrane protein assembly factor BamD (BamD/ComL family)
MLLDEARAGLVQGEPSRALERLNAHQHRYPTGLLAEERDAMMVEALVRAGHYAAARQAADAFRTRAPNSLFLPTIESAVASIP